jgi:hypothetical protein
MGIDVAPFQTRGSGKHLIWNEVRCVGARVALCACVWHAHRRARPAAAAGSVLTAVHWLLLRASRGPLQPPPRTLVWPGWRRRRLQQRQRQRPC